VSGNDDCSIGEPLDDRVSIGEQHVRRIDGLDMPSQIVRPDALGASRRGLRNGTSSLPRRVDLLRVHVAPIARSALVLPRDQAPHRSTLCDDRSIVRQSGREPETGTGSADVIDRARLGGHQNHEAWFAPDRERRDEARVCLARRAARLRFSVEARSLHRPAWREERDGGRRSRTDSSEQHRGGNGWPRR